MPPRKARRCEAPAVPGGFCSSDGNTTRIRRQRASASGAGRARRARGQSLSRPGDWLTLGTDDELGSLAKVDIVAAPIEHIRRRWPNIVGEPWMVIIRGDSAEALDAQMDRGATAADIHRRIAVLAALARAAIGTSPADSNLRQRLLDIPGSLWAVSGCLGFGPRFLNTESQMPPCGVGHIPKHSRRFLYFYTQGPP